jgi:cell division protein YceG involved in septum cleavage
LSRGDRSRPERERTPEEREREREERAKRRALRGGGAVEPPPVTPPSPMSEPPEPLPVQEPRPASLEPAPTEPAPPEPAPPEPAPTEPAPLEPDPPEPAPTEPDLPAPAPLEVPEPSPLDAPEPAPPVSFEVPEPPAAPGRPVVGAGAPRARRSTPARIGALIALSAAIAAVVLVARALLDTGHTKSVAAPKVIRLLIPEGRTRAQIAELAGKAGLKGSYRLASRSSPLLSPAHYGAPHDTSSLEGFLFPATFDVNPGQPVSRLVQEQLVAFRENFGASELASARALRVTPYELLTVASMVEREAQVPADRAKIAAVIYNRLKLGIPLGIDATIYYAVEQQQGIATYTHELTEAQLHINSRYNTRTHTGLPPTPISNPGAASIKAAARPAHVSYLYYVAGADGCGEQIFSTTLAAFEVNAAAYKAAVAKNGGHPPTCKHK